MKQSESSEEINKHVDKGDATEDWSGVCPDWPAWRLRDETEHFGSSCQ